ncbi:MAG: T9SS type A sorting domain-containing protein, partial [Cyclobacteriaceae bacterium]
GSDGDGSGSDGDGSGSDGDGSGSGGDGSDSDGDGSGSDGGNNNDKSCTDCFDSDVTEVQENDNCTTYTITVSQETDCRYDLSHYTVSIPSCASVSGMSNSEGWPMSIGTDPTTGVFGIKVDEVKGFGSRVGDSFTVTYTLCADSESCFENTECYTPMAAYKAGTCVMDESLTEVCRSLSNTSFAGIEMEAYPNPMNGEGNINFTSSRSSDVKVELFRLTGNKVATLFEGNVAAGEKVNLSVSVAELGLEEETYIYRITSNHEVATGRIMVFK